MNLVIDIAPGGAAQCVFNDALAPFIAHLERPDIKRASHVEPVIVGSNQEIGVYDIYGGEIHWQADMAPVGGPVLGPYPSRTEALAAEHDWLLANYLGKGGTT